MLKLKLNDVGEHWIMLGLGERSWKKVARFPQPLTELADPNIKACLLVKAWFLVFVEEIQDQVMH